MDAKRNEKAEVLTSAEAFLSAGRAGIKVRRVFVKAWDKWVNLRRWSGEARDRFEGLIQRQGDAKNLRALTAVLSVCDGSGTLLLIKEERLGDAKALDAAIASVNLLDVAGLNEIFVEAGKFNALNDEELKVFLGNSIGTQNGASPSD